MDPVGLTVLGLLFMSLLYSSGNIVTGVNQGKYTKADEGYNTKPNHSIWDDYSADDLNMSYIKSQDRYKGLSDEDLNRLQELYKGDLFNGDVGSTFNPKNWFVTDPTRFFDWQGFNEAVDLLKNAYANIGEMPEQLSGSEIAGIRQNAEDEINAEYQDLENTYRQSIAENSSLFSDYRNQLLTNEAMQQQAIAGAARFELDRQQRNAITRGASAAQRLVANINTQLGLQAQSAQQSLNTSNALAQSLLAHRQAQQGVRNQYAQSQLGRAERRANYSQSKVDAARYDREAAYDAWVNQRDEYFRNHKELTGIYGNGSSYRPGTNYGI